MRCVMVGPFGLVWFVVASAYTGCCHSVNWKLRDVCHIVSRAGIEPAFTRHRRSARQGRGSEVPSAVSGYSVRLSPSLWKRSTGGANPVATACTVAFHVI
nr:MAG TPA: hypothetical protein [Caudoviricetes sp.]